MSHHRIKAKHLHIVHVSNVNYHPSQVGALKMFLRKTRSLPLVMPFLDFFLNV